MLLTYSDEQAIREIYLKPFEICVKNFEGQSLAVMSSFNFVGDRWTGANPNLLNNVLRDEWGFRGMVLTDWNGSYGYQNTDDAVRNGNDAMLGFASKESNKITEYFLRNSGKSNAPGLQEYPVHYRQQRQLHRPGSRRRQNVQHDKTVPGD